MTTVFDTLLEEFKTEESPGGCYHLAVLFFLYPGLIKRPELSNSYPNLPPLIKNSATQFKELLDKIDWSYWSVSEEHFGEKFLERSIEHGVLEAHLMMARRALGHGNRYKLAAQHYGAFFRYFLMNRRKILVKHYLDEYF